MLAQLISRSAVLKIIIVFGVLGAWCEGESTTVPLGRGSLSQGIPAYRLEKEINFNVLDSVYFDPKSGQITLVGHNDNTYRGLTIPYLQHLATLLENPRP